LGTCTRLVGNSDKFVAFDRIRLNWLLFWIE